MRGPTAPNVVAGSMSKMSETLATARMTGSNWAALATVRAQAAPGREERLRRIEQTLAGTGVEGQQLLSELSRQGSLTLNFHPDRLIGDGRSVAQALFEDGTYRGQFETRISNGGLTAYPGGYRDAWEAALFGGCYQRAGVGPGERPKYGGLNLMNHLNGACPRFGSCHLRLKATVRERATLLYGDSAEGRAELGTVDAFEAVLAPLLEDLAAGHGALGRAELDLGGFVDGVVGKDIAAGRGLFVPAMTNALNDYVEAQVHGVIELAGDVEAVVIDPAFVDTSIAASLIAAAQRYGLSIEWHRGTGLAVSDVPASSSQVAGQPPMRWELLLDQGRGRRLAQLVVGRHGQTDGRLDAAGIGQAAVSVVRDPGLWGDWGTQPEVLVHLKDLWLMLVALGDPLR